MDVFLNIILCSVFIVLINCFSCWTQKPDDEIFRKQLEMRFKEWKFFFFIREIIEDLTAAVASIIMLHSAVSTPAISKEMESMHITVTGYEYLYITFLVLIVLYIVLSFLQGDVFTRIGKGNIQCRTPSGKKYVIHYTDLTSYSISPHGNLKLYKKDQCVLSVTSQKKKDVLIEVLKNRKIPRKERPLLVLELEKNIFYSVLLVMPSVYLCF